MKEHFTTFLNSMIYSEVLVGDLVSHHNILPLSHLYSIGLKSPELAIYPRNCDLQAVLFLPNWYYN